MKTKLILHTLFLVVAWTFIALGTTSAQSLNKRG
jgi:hypothetical protein